MAGDVRRALDRSIREAVKQGLIDRQLDAGAIEAARALADKIDAWDVIVDWALDDAADSGGRPAVPQHDNVSLSALLNYLQHFGLTPASRKKLFDVKGGAGGKLAQLRAIEGGRTKRA